ncbi:tail fiber domain-containing protein [Ulvibacter antarcticus]|uniref:Endosialidase-like protein n=1 Tax=Ulvibacter antarcticus TaxID=442714 RepID=A0A3L9Z0H0_9FLAO|nr:tail fiber domain-containing protein [Ulvibacter antarcticus]RMA66461.1 endosialidase-like protein [Ulvibacter antarcticus]
MKNPNHKIVSLLFGMFISISVTAQVGIGTTNPQGALDISSANGGLVVPRTNLLSIADILTIANPLGGGPVKGTVVYNLGSLITEGFYVFNGLTWEILKNSDTNTYLGANDQTLTGNRTIDLNYFNLDFNVANNGTNGVTIDTDMLSLSRDGGNSGDGLISSRGGMAFNIDNNNNNTNDNEYFSWGQDGALDEGTGDSSYEEYMRLNNTGLGIGIEPQYALHVKETTENVNIAKFESPEFPMFAGFIIEDTGGNNTSRFAITPGNIANNGSAALAGVGANNANGKNSVTFDIEGSTFDVYTFMEGVIRPGFNNLTSLGTANHRFTNLYLVNSPNTSSDIRLKENIVETTYGLETVLKVTPVSYELIDDVTNKVHLGFKAQQIQELVPEIVEAAEGTGMLSVAYSEMIPVLTKAIQELNAKVDRLIEENNTLRAQSSGLSSSLRE